MLDQKHLAGRSRKFACGFTLALVFLCGALVGAVLMDVRVHSVQKAAAFDTIDGRAAYFAKVEKDLELTPAQAAQMESILNDFWQYYRTVLSDGKQRIEQVLTPEQKIKFDRMLQENKKK